MSEVFCLLYEYQDTQGVKEIDIWRVIGMALATALGGAILNGAIYGRVPPKTREEYAQILGAFTASGFVGLLAGLIAQR
ncbi:MAG: hypothetical protein QXW83_04425 [Nitrososphaerales archaeon]